MIPNKANFEQYGATLKKVDDLKKRRDLLLSKTSEDIAVPQVCTETGCIGEDFKKNKATADPGKKGPGTNGNDSVSETLITGISNQALLSGVAGFSILACGYWLYNRNN